MERVQTRYLQFRVEGGLDEQLASRIEDFGAKHKADWLVSVDDVVTVRTPSRMNFRKGMRSLRKKLSTEKTLILQTPDFPFPEAFLRRAMPGGTIDENRLMIKYGEAVERILADHAAGKTYNRFQNRVLLQKSAEQCVEDGEVSVLQYENLKRNKEQYERGKAELNHNPDSDAPIEFTFRRRKVDPDTKVVEEDGPATDFTLRRFPDEPEVKQRHYYIYSDKGGYGKTYFLALLEKTANACFVTDPNNLYDARASAQLLLLDEAAPDKCPSFANLKALCSGKGAGLNVKSHGASFSPRPDVQIVICSNTCPYSLYGRYDAKRGRRVMGETAYSTFTERFHVLKLDGDLSEDRAKFLEPALLTPEERRASFTYPLKHPLPLAARKRVVISVMRKRLAKAVATALSLIDRDQQPVFYSMHDMFEFFDAEIPVSREVGVSWYELGTRFWFDDGEKKPDVKISDVVKEILGLMPSERPSIEWVAEQVRDKSPRELLTWLRGNGTFHHVLADYYKRELAGEKERPEKLLRHRCMVLHGYDQRGDAFVYKDCIWPLLTDLLRGLKCAVEEDDDYEAW